MVIAILAGVGGALVVFALVSVLAGLLGRAREGGRGLPVWVERLREARGQFVATLGPAGGFFLFFGSGVFAVTGVGIALGETLALLEDTVDRPTFRLMERVHDRDWAQMVEFVGRMGNIPQTRGVALVAAVGLIFLAPGRRWAPPVLIGTVVVTQKYVQSGLAKIVDRGHPPTTLGTYPSGGCARTIAIFGVIAFVVLCCTGASRRWRSATWGLIAMLAFIEGYSRTYLNKHWVTDVVGGWVFGGMLLAVTVFAGRALLAPRVRAGAGAAVGAGAPDGGTGDAADGVAKADVPVPARGSTG
jgi:membrane-associated phospholipid phosphatase